MASLTIRVVPAVFHAKGSDSYIPAVRFVDPDRAEDEGPEFFRVDVKYVEELIASIRRAAADASARSDQLTTAAPDDRALLLTAAGGRA